MVSTVNKTAQNSRSFTWTLRIFLCLVIHSLLFWAWLTYLVYFLKEMDSESLSKVYGLLFNAKSNREGVNAKESMLNLSSKNE